MKENTYNLTRMNLVMRGIKPDNIVTRNGDTLEEDWPYFDENDPVNTYNPLYVDAVVSKVFFEKHEQTKLIPPKVNMKTDQLLRQFILSGGFEVDVP